MHQLKSQPLAQMLLRVAYSSAAGCLQAQLLLESAAAMKSKTSRDGAFAVLSACALKYGQLEAVAGAAVGALARNEHMAAALAELAEYSQAKYDDARLVSPSPTFSTHNIPEPSFAEVQWIVAFPNNGRN